MNKKIYGLGLGVLAMSAAIADEDLTGVDTLLCAPGWVTVCTATGECESGPPGNWDIPDFIEIDLDDETMSTTDAFEADSLEEDRTTLIQLLTRLDGNIFLQGVQGGNAFSFVITEATGDLSVAIVTEGETATGFGACTPD